MSIVVPQQGLNALLGYSRTALAALITATKLKVRLFTNNYSPINTTKVSDFTEATFTGYAAQNVPTLSADFINSDGNAEFAATAQNIWTASDAVSPNTVYGYWVADETSTPILLWCEKFDTPVDMLAGGNTLMLLLRFIQASQF